MRRVIRKAIFAWNFDREEKWLNEMAAKGMALVSVGFCKYEFEDSEPGEYRVCMQLLDKLPAHPESQKYIEFIEGTGAEHVGSYMRWVYFRRKAADGAFELFSDHESRTGYLTRVISFLTIITAANILIGLNNIWIAIALRSPANYLGLLNLALAAWGAFGTAKVMKKRRRMRQEGQLFE